MSHAGVQVRQLCRALGDVGVRVETDLEDHHSPGWKYNFWELKACTPPLCIHQQQPCIRYVQL